MAFLQRIRKLILTMIHGIWRLLLWHSRLLLRLMLVVVVFLLVVAAAWQFWFVPRLENYRPMLVRELSRVAGVKVEVGEIKGSWDGWRPELSLQQVRTFDQYDLPALSFAQLNGALSWWALPLGKLSFSHIELVAPELKVVRLQNGGWRVAGVTLNAGGEKSGLLNWLLEQDSLSISHGRLLLLDEAQSGLSLDLAQFDFQTSQLFGKRRLGFGFTPPALIGQRVTGDGMVSGEDIHHLEAWSGRVRFNFPQVDLARFNERFAAFLPKVTDTLPAIREGQGRLLVALQFAGGMVSQLDADLGVKQLRLEYETHGLDLPLFDAAAHWESRKGRESLALDVRSIDGVDGPLARNGRFEYVLNGAERELSLHGLKLGGLSSYASLLPAGWPEKLAGAKLSGEVKNLSYIWQGPLQQPVHWRGELAVNGLDLVSPAWLPHLGKLDVASKFDEKTGSLTLSSTDFQLAWPAQFAETLALNRLNTTVNWKRVDAGWEMQTDRLALGNPEASVAVAGLYRWTGNGLGYIDMKGDIGLLPAQRVHAYLPRAVGDETLAWLKSSLLTGKASNGKAELRGELAQFPFVNGVPGLFRITAVANDVSLDFAKGWPVLSGINGDLRFEGQSMIIRARQGKAFDARLKDVVARIPDLSANSHLLIDGKAEGPAASMLRYVKESPVRQMTDGFLDDAKIDGVTQLDLSLDIPIDDTDRTKVSGRVQLVGNRVDLGGSIPLLNQASGRVEFTQASLKVSDVTARALGGAAKVAGAMDASGSLRLVLSGDADLREVTQRYGLPQAKRLSGMATYQGDLLVRQNRYELALQSPLTAVQVDLPAPLGKLPGEVRPLRLKISGDAQRQAIEFGYARLLQGALSQQTDKSYSGVVNLGAAIPVVSAASKTVQVGGGWPELDLTAWQALLDDDGAGQAPAISSVDLAFDRLSGWGHQLNAVKLKANPVTLGWSVNLVSKEAQGNLNWRGGSRPRMTGRLARLYLPLGSVLATPAKVASASAKKESDIIGIKPALDLIVDDFRYKESDLGRLAIIANPNGEGWQLSDVSVSNPDGRFSMTGQWLQGGGVNRTRAQFSMKSENTGKLMARMGYPDALRRAPTSISGEGNWQGSPFSPELGTLQGKLRLDVEAGQFTKIEPGAGRLLSLISLQSLSRRIKLDFRDVFSDGLEFDSISGDALIEKGIAHTDNLAIDSSSAKVRFYGDANLAAGTQNIRVHIVPSVGDTTAFAIGVVNPVAGVAAFALQRLMKDPLGHLISYEYEITGDMQDPQVRKVH